MKFIYPLLLAVLCALPAAAQRLVLTGQVLEASTGQPVPFASIFVPRSSNGVTADADGKFKLVVAGTPDSLGASALGFATQRRHLSKEAAQTIVFRLKPGGVELAEVVIRPGENPAFAILRQVQKHKSENARDRLESVEFDAYNRTQTSLTEIPQRLAKSKVVKDLRALANRQGATAAGDPNAALPLFASEVSSKVYLHYNPDRRREEILHTQIRGIGPREGSIVSQMLGSSFQNFDFYPNWTTFLGKDFISPIAEGGRITYEYELQDSLFIGKDWCYQIACTPKREHDLAFKGTIWITAGSYALRRVNLVASKYANINFVDQIRIYQEFSSPTEGPGVPTRTRLTLGIRPTEKQAAMVVGFTTVATNIVRNKPQELAFYDHPVTTVAGAQGGPSNYFDTQRPDTLTVDERQTFAVLDSAKQLPSVRTLLDYVDLVVNGYKNAGKFDIGPVLYTYAYNNVEGNRIRLGFRSSPDLSKNWVTQGYLAFGTRDEKFKYSLRIDRILERKHWTLIGVEHRHDLEQVPLLDNDFLPENSLFAAASRFGNVRRRGPLMRDLDAIYVQRDLFHNFQQKVMFRRQSFDPLFDFAFLREPDRPATSPLGFDFSLSELVLESRYAPDENMIQGENRRRAVGIPKWPIFTFRYTMGMDKVLGSDFRYQKFNLLVTHSLQLGQLGRTNYRFETGLIPSTVPYPILKNHLGNETPFFNVNAFNLMRFNEFVSDRFASLRVEQHFEGLFLNGIPGIRALNWRLLASANVLFGSVSEANRDLLPPREVHGRPLDRFRALGSDPYVEVGYGVENIFKLLRVDFIHRLTYRELPGVHNFGVRLGVQFRL